MKTGLTLQQIEQFIQDGFVRIDHAFSEPLAREARAILWRDTGCDPDDPATWTRPVIRLGMYSDPPFLAAAQTEILQAAFDQLAGPRRWIPCRSMGSFPVRFPLREETGDTGWHVDASFAGDDPTGFLEWRVNWRSKGRGLLMLFLFSDTSERDAPTRLRIGSHQDVARLLKPYGEAGLSFMELAGKLPELPERLETRAVGKAGTVYLCHPFLVHAAQPHSGTEPRFLAQPPLLLRRDFDMGGSETGISPVEEAILRASSSA
ncbi:phytanoyl-CoA dioxygenase family protein [Larkinella soli]|uniref:phytanoyl-CoA dioxygenase family protein n=1 Tax=Larkinella soli TaxID=1770527 RepID=UPI000FFB66F0|nr:phytanoyl-CoA dioxygenase family protein [Larkinella soli]